MTAARQIGGETTTTTHGIGSGIEAGQERGLGLEIEEIETAVLIVTGTGGTALGIVLEKGRRRDAEIGIGSARVRGTRAVIVESLRTKIAGIVSKRYDQVFQQAVASMLRVSHLCLPR